MDAYTWPMSPVDLRARLWRARRRHDHIDAMLRHVAAGWDLIYLRGERPLVTLRFADRAAAVADADRRLRDLLRAGWNVHW
jgi:hypothetical protein